MSQWNIQDADKDLDDHYQNEEDWVSFQDLDPNQT